MYSIGNPALYGFADFLFLSTEAVHHCVEGEAGGSFYAELRGDVFSVGEDCIEADAEFVGYVLVGVSLDDELEYVDFARG